MVASSQTNLVPQPYFLVFELLARNWWVGQLDGYKHDSGGEGRFMRILSAHRLLRMAVVAWRGDDAMHCYFNSIRKIYLTPSRLGH